MNKAFKICKEDPILKSALSYLIANNMGNTNPYHSFEHSVNVFLGCAEASDYHSVPDKERLNLLIAALFHDFNHSGGKYTDNVNIQNALLAVQSWIKDRDDGELDFEQIKSLIEITEYPYKVDSNSLNLQQQILRDADMESIFTENFFQSVMLGLSGEIKVGMEAFIEQQKTFISNLKPNTPWFQKTRIPLIQEKLDDLNLYAEFIYDNIQ